jgi:hypothetical protein
MPGCLARAAFLVGAVLTAATPVAAALPDWLDPAASTLANAQQAVRAEVPPADATDALIAAGDAPDHVVAAVIDAYDRCDAVYDGVRAATRRAPDRAGDIVQAAASAARCPCSADQAWQRSRLERRIRIEQRSDPVAIVSTCGCTAAGAEAAMAAAPERADEVLQAALDASRRAAAVVDSIGRLGDPRGPAQGAPAGLVRDAARRCERDAVPEDAFAPGAAWLAAEAAPPPRAAGRCQDDDDDDDARADDLVIERWTARDGDRALALFNGTGEAIDLGAGNYQLELAFPGRDATARRIPLSGVVPAGGWHVVVGRGSAARWLERADQVVAGGLMSPNDAVLLRRGLERDGCDCATAAVAGTANGLGGAGADWLAAQAGDGPQRLVADRVGQVRPETFDPAAWQAPLASAPLRLSRADPRCTAGTRPEAPFATGTDWRDLALAAPPRCEVTPGNVLLSAFESFPPAREGAAPARVAAVFNATGAAVDLARDGYVLEVFAFGSREPARVVPLEGTLAPGAALAVASPDAPDAVRDAAAIVSADLALASLDAVVLRRLASGAGGVCRAAVYAAAREVGSPPIVIAAAPDDRGEGEPRTDESPLDPDRGGDVASPN